MKRKNNLYQNTYKMENISEAYNEVCSHIRNRKKASNYKEYKCIYISRIYETLKNKTYEVGPYNVFFLFLPKKRRIVSQSLHDKVINHLVSREILMPSVIPCLVDENIASRKNMGTNKGIKLANKYRKICNIKYKRYYILKCDISKFFASIDNYKLKEKLKKRIKDKDALKIIFNIIDIEEAGLSIRLYDKPSTSHILFK